MSRKRVAAFVGVVIAAAVAGGRLAEPADAASPSIWPTPQSLVIHKGSAAVTARADLVIRGPADAAAVTTVRTALWKSGATVAGSGSAADGRLTVIVGRDRGVERALGATGASDLPAGGYVLAAGRVKGRDVVILDGADSAGQYYAAQTFRQLIDERASIPFVTIRDWPSLTSRGVVEGFYGRPWSAASRLATLDYLGQHKANLYLYLPKDDPYVRGDWRSALPTPYLGYMRQLAARATRDHITFAYGVSPGDSVCYSSPDDRNALVAKLRSLDDAGVHSFVLAFDDIDPTRPLCQSDIDAFGTGPTALASAQAAFVRAVAPPGRALSVVPTEYSGFVGTPYQRTLAALLPRDVVVQWTGPSVVSSGITTADLSQAGAVYTHPLLVWDNLFVNDLLPGYLVLGPFSGRSASLGTVARGLVVNPLNQVEASRIGLFTATDFSWNTEAYRPARSWTASLREAAGPDPEAVAALRTFAEANFGSPVLGTEAPKLAAATGLYWKRWNAGDADAGVPLTPLFTRLRDAPAIVRERVRDRALVAEISPWLDATALWGSSAAAAVDLMKARRAGQADRAAADEQLARSARSQATLMNVPGSSPPASIRIAGGVLSDFVHYALRGYGP